VETSHILDVYHSHGLEAFAQTDLDQRIHRNQTTLALGKMSFGILQTFLRRMKSYGMFDRLPDMAHIYRQFQAHEKSYEQVTFEIVEEERRPMIEVPAYREKFHAKKK